MNISNKSILAKLLATENVSVEHKNVRTAYFDLKERKVVLPVFKEMSSDLYDLLIGHEVSHALNTPLQGWHDASSVQGNGFKSYLNVVEDARIETDIKRRYPGLVKNFYKGYRELYEMDFFGLDRDINEYPLIDRINLHFKVGMFAAVDFSAEELVYVDKVAACETWEDVVAVATELYELAKLNEDVLDTKDVEQFMQQMSDDAETEEGNENTTNGEEQESTDGDSDSEKTGEEETEETVASDTTEEKSEGDFEPASITDINYRKAEGQLVQDNAPEYHYGKFPKLDYKKWILMDPWSKWEQFQFQRKVKNEGSEFVNCWIDVDVDYETAVDELQNNFNLKNRAYINMMVQQFEAKRKAAQFAKAREHKTGDLNMNKLWATKLTEDVFLSNTVVPDGKNHGMLMVIDFSGSMHDKIQATIEQLLIQVAFCKKVNIPFEVYSFTNFRTADVVKHLVANQREGDLKIDDQELCVMKLFSSDMSTPKYKQAVRNMLAMSACYTDNKHRYNENLPFAWSRSLPMQFWLGGTPLAETIMLLRDRAIDFRNENKIDVLNTLFLTDGGNTGDIEVPGRRGTHFRNEGVVITENGMNTSAGNTNRFYGMRFSDIVCNALIKHYDKTTGSRTINYYLDNPTKSDLRYQYVNLYGWDAEGKFEEVYKRDFLKEGFLQVDGLNGFPTAYIVRAKDLGDVEELKVTGDKKGDFVRGFKKFQSSKSKSRKFLNNFIEKIA